MKHTLLVAALVLVVWSCSDDNDDPAGNNDNFDRGAMLTNWADNIILPSYQAYVADLEDLATSAGAFSNETTFENLEALRVSWLEAYTSWQSVSMFEIGKAEELTLRDFTNIFPTSATKIEANIESGQYNLELPSTRDQQGFPALDYLLNGIGSNDADIVTVYQNDPAYRDYLQALVTRLNTLGTMVLEDWQNDYRDEFVENNGSEASSSVNKLANDYLFYYEKALRAGKIGIPAGVFSNTSLSDRVEALYKRDVSKRLFETALDATIDFFNGVHFDGTGQGESLNTYLVFLNTIQEGENLSNLINNQFDAAKSAGSNLGNDFFAEVETNNQAMLAAYDELQANVVLLKVDMFQALNIKVDFVDADGD